MGFNSGFKGLMENLPVSADLFSADGRIDRHDERNGRLSQLLRKHLKIYIVVEHSPKSNIGLMEDTQAQRTGI